MSVPTYAYAANNPLRYIDPTGLEVIGLYDRSTGVLALRDLDSGERWTGQFHHGSDGNEIPVGTYEILSHPDRDFFRLDALDDNPRDDQFGGRTSFRLHKPGGSLGCMTSGRTREGRNSESNREWELVRDFIQATSTSTVFDQKPANKAGGVIPLPLRRFGTVRVVDGWHATLSP